LLGSKEIILLLMLAHADRFLHYTAAPQGNAVIPAKRDFQGQAFAQTWREADAPDVTVMAEMKRAIVRERETWPEVMQEQSRMKSTLLIAAAIIATVRLARDPDISRPKPDA
jgi:hypothetical protein